MKKLFLLAGLAIALGISPAEAAKMRGGSSSKSSLDLMRFRAGGVGLVQQNLFTMSGMVQFTPRLELSRDLGVSVHGGFTAFKGTSGLIPVIEGLGVADYGLAKSLTLEGGAGIQLWMNNEGMRLTAVGGLHYMLEKKIFGLISSLYVQYAGIFGTNFAHSGRAGIGITL